jgi:hypothetical protein
MTPTALDFWVLARLVADMPLNGEAAAMSAELRPLADRLAAMPPDRRADMLDVASLYMPKRADFLKAVALADRNGSAPAPAANGPPRSATLATMRKLMANTSWPWPGWLAGASLNSLAADPGIGKTILAVTLASILWFRRPWPDGQANPFPEKTRTLWLPADHQYPQLMDLATACGLPDDAIVFNAPEDDPTGGLDLDDPDVRDALKDRIVTEAPGLTIIDTVGMTTGLNLCRPEDARAYFGPLMAMANETATPFLLLTHLSRDMQALGRRIVGASRVVWKLTHPDPDGQPDRRRLWVDKSYAVKPVPLGMSIADAGCTFDFNPPEAPEPRPPGRPSDKRDKAARFIREALTALNDQIGNVLSDRWEKDHGGSSKTFWRAVDDMSDAGELATDGGKGTGKQTILHLIGQNPTVP